jgi:hypothetical protein
MRIVAFVLDRPVVERILEHIGESTQPHVVLPARSPPQLALGFDQTIATAEWPEMDQTAGRGRGRLGVIPLKGDRARDVASAGRRMGACVRDGVKIGATRRGIGGKEGGRAGRLTLGDSVGDTRGVSGGAITRVWRGESRVEFPIPKSIVLVKWEVK